jgi:hypothetical protein
LIDIANANERFETYIMRPALIVPMEPSLGMSVASALVGSIKVDVLAKAMIELALNGHKEQTFENADITKLRFLAKE